MYSNIALPGPDEHAAWLKSRRRQLLKVLGGPGFEGPLRGGVRNRTQTDETVIENVLYEGEPGEYIPATLLIPRGRSLPLPAVICLHAQEADRTRGRSDVIAFGGIGTELCHRGYIVLVPEMFGYQERQDSPDDLESGRLLLQGWSLPAKMVWEVRRALEYLVTRPEVQPNRIGVLGLGKGGMIASLTAAIEARLAVTAVCWGTSTYAAILNQEISLGTSGWLPGLLNWGDIPEVCCLVAPRPLFFCAAQQDPLFPIKGYEEVHWRVRQLYLRLGEEEKLNQYLLTGPPRFDREARARLANWFDRWL